MRARYFDYLVLFKYELQLSLQIQQLQDCLVKTKVPVDPFIPYLGINIKTH
eukprot:COSAG02_NODE_49_length_45106_cov_298.436177_9_plen_51_part_00